MSKVYVDAISHQSSQGSGTITIGASGETVNVVGTLQNNGAGVGGVNTPSFFAVRSSTQTIPTGTYTKIQYDSEVFDSDNCYDNSTNYRFTPTEAGKYYVCGWMHINSAPLKLITIYKNGSAVTNHRLDDSTAVEATIRVISIIDMNGTSDYLEIFGYQTQGTSQSIEGNTSNQRTGFFAYKIIGA